MQRLQLVREAKLPSLPTDDGKLRRLEASGVLAYEGQLNVIFDKVSQLARIDASCASNPGNAWLGNPDRSPGHEDIASSPYRERFYVLVEAVAYPGGERATGAWSCPRLLKATSQGHACPWSCVCSCPCKNVLF
jgi:hypothetical protein